MLKKIMMLLGGEKVVVPISHDSEQTIDVTGKTEYRLEGQGRGINSSAILTGITDVLTVENCVCTLREFNGKLIAKNSQIYADSAQGTIELENSSLDILGNVEANINSVFSYIKIDPVFSNFAGSVKASLGGAYVGSTKALENDGTVAVQDTTVPEVEADPFSAEKVRIADYRALEALPHFKIDDSRVVVRIKDRFMLFTLAKGATNTRVKSAAEVYVNYVNGVALVDASGNVVYRKH